MKRFLEHAERVVSIESTTERGNEELVNYLAVLLQNRGLKINIQNVMHSVEQLSKRQFNIIGIMGSTLSDRKIKKGLLLTSHLDTVKPGIREQWEHCEGNPLSAQIKDDKLYGLGVADGKIDFLAKLFAVYKYREKALKEPIYLLGTCGDKMGMFGSKYFIQSYVLNPKYILVGMPTDLQAITQHKSLSSYSIKISYHVIERGARGFNRRVRLYSNGRSSHSAFPDGSINAIQNALDFLHQAVENGFEMKFTRMEGGSVYHQVPDSMVADFCLTSHQVEDFRRFFTEKVQSTRSKKNLFRLEMGGLGDAGIRFLPDTLFPSILQILKALDDLRKELQKTTDPFFNPPHATLSVLGLTQDQQFSSIDFDLHDLPQADEAQFRNKIESIIRGISQQYPGMNITLKQTRHIPGLRYQGPLTEMTLDALKSLKLHSNAEFGAFSSEASLYAQKGYDVLAIGPGTMANNIHGPDECIELSAIEKAISFYEQIIERICL